MRLEFWTLSLILLLLALARGEREYRPVAPPTVILEAPTDSGKPPQYRTGGGAVIRTKPVPPVKQDWPWSDWSE